MAYAKAHLAHTHGQQAVANAIQAAHSMYQAGQHAAASGLSSVGPHGSANTAVSLFSVGRSATLGGALASHHMHGQSTFALGRASDLVNQIGNSRHNSSSAQQLSSQGPVSSGTDGEVVSARSDLVGSDAIAPSSAATGAGQPPQLHDPLSARSLGAAPLSGGSASDSRSSLFSIGKGTSPEQSPTNDEQKPNRRKSFVEAAAAGIAGGGADSNGISAGAVDRTSTDASAAQKQPACLPVAVATAAVPAPVASQPASSPDRLNQAPTSAAGVANGSSGSSSSSAAAAAINAAGVSASSQQQQAHATPQNLLSGPSASNAPTITQPVPQLHARVMSLRIGIAGHHGSVGNDLGGMAGGLNTPGGGSVSSSTGSASSSGPSLSDLFNACDKHGETIVQLAAAAGSKDVLELFVTVYPRVLKQVKGGNHNTLLHYATIGPSHIAGEQHGHKPRG